MRGDLVVLSHLRWNWVWQRPQHLISRLSSGFERTFFVEEPEPGDVPGPRLTTEPDGPVTRVWLDVPGEPNVVLGGEGYVYFDAPEAADYGQRLAELLGPGRDRLVWLYSPLALDIARAVDPAMLVYDVMDDLSSFASAPPELALCQREALEVADVVFAGGRSLQRMAQTVRPDAHLFPSGVEAEHYAAARTLRSGDRTRPVAGYVGVIDERLDRDLVAGLAAALPDWEIRMVGPLAKLTSADLPAAPNLVYTGPEPYGRLPEVMAGFDVALMPFAVNDATRSISPTKTLEYLAAGLPVVSTRVPDVVADFGEVVDLRDDARGFAQGCRLGRAAGLDDRLVRPLLTWHSWDGIAARMAELIGGTA
jgi:glycosyltransferase involved in cell wall biosynthesis